MLSDLDVIGLPDGGYQLVAGGSMFRVTFDNPDEKAMFDILVEERNKPNKTIFRMIVKKFSRASAMSFFDKLRHAGIIVFDDEDSLVAGRVFDMSEARRFNVEKAAETPITVLVSSSLGELLKVYEIFANARFVDMRRRADGSGLDSLVGEAKFVVADVAAHNPRLLNRLNELMFERGIPWLMLHGVQEKRGLVGPMFFGLDTGCYNCLRERLRSNTMHLPAFDTYERWLDEHASFGSEAPLGSKAFLHHLASMAAMEVENLLLEIGLPQTYGYMLSVDPCTYRVEPHRLYKVPFCEVCNSNFEYRRAPWLDSITLRAS